MAFLEEHEVQRKQHGIQRKTVHQGDCRGGAVHRGSEKLHLALLARPDESFGGAARSQNPLDFVEARYRVELVEVEMIGPGAAQALLQFLAGALRAALHRFASQERALAVGLEGRPQLRLRLPIEVTRSHVEVVHAPVESLCYGAVRFFLLHAHDDHASEANHGQPNVVLV